MNEKYSASTCTDKHDTKTKFAFKKDLISNQKSKQMDG